MISLSCFQEIRASIPVEIHLDPAPRSDQISGAHGGGIKSEGSGTCLQNTVMGFDSPRHFKDIPLAFYKVGGIMLL